jgi:peptide/nickel transport system substrate-binding protein
MFDTLVTSDENGRLQPSLATSWQVAPAKQRWQFRLRRGVKFHDGTPLTAEIAAASLRNANPSWTVTVEAESVVIEQDSADPDLPAELALARNAIVRRNADGTTSGTGPFHIVDWQAGKKLTLAAEEACWHGRPYLDGIEIEMGRNYHDQMMSLDLGKADLAEVPAEQVHRAALEGRGLVSSFPVELLALVFARDASAPEEKLLREALAFSVERGSIRSVLLQGMGRPAGGVLPDWISGYGFVFPTDADLTRARHAREQVHTIPAWTLGYDGTDGLARLLAERIALNAKDAGLSVQPTSAAVTDVRLVRISLASADAWIALTQMGALVGFSVARKNDGAAEDLYNAEQSLLTTQRIIPLFHLPASYAAAANLKDWTVRPDGTWNLADAWLGSRRP